MFASLHLAARWYQSALPQAALLVPKARDSCCFLGSRKPYPAQARKGLKGNSEPERYWNLSATFATFSWKTSQNDFFNTKRSVLHHFCGKQKQNNSTSQRVGIIADSSPKVPKVTPKKNSPPLVDPLKCDPIVPGKRFRSRLNLSIDRLWKIAIPPQIQSKG